METTKDDIDVDMSDKRGTTVELEKKRATIVELDPNQQQRSSPSMTIIPEKLDKNQYKRNYLRAAVYVDSAFSSKEHTFEISERPYALELHWLLHNTKILKQIVVFGLLLLPFFEVPSWCYVDLNCGQSNVTLTSGLPVLDRQNGLLIEFSILLALTIFSFMKLWSNTFSSWIASRAYVITMILLFISMIDVLFTFGYPHTWRISPFCRPLLFVSLTVSVRECFFGILMGFRSILEVMILEALWIFFMSWFGIVLFADIPDYFTSLPTALMDMLTLLTTANFPDVAVPAIIVSRAYIIYFGLFLIVGLWFLMNMVLATIYSSYRKWIEKKKENCNTRKDHYLKKAFREIEMIRESGSLNFKEIHGLFKELNRYIHFPYIKTKQAQLLFQSLDLAKNGTIFENEFLHLDEVLELEFEITSGDHKTFLQHHFPIIMNSKPYLIFSSIIQNYIFEYLIDVFIVINLILTAFDLWVPSLHFWSGYEYIFTFIFFIEMILKIIALGGLHEYWEKDKNRFDGLITVACVVVEIIVLVPNDFNKAEVTRVILMFRVARLLRLFLSFENYQILALTYISLLPVYLQLAGVLMVVYYFFCFIGIASFGGKIYIGAPALNGTQFEAGNYMMLNFNDFGSGMITLFSLMVVNNWFVIMDGFVSVTSQGAQVYFIAFWIVAVVTILSVVVASVLDRFISEMDNKKNQKDGIDPLLLDGIKTEEGEAIIVRRRKKSSL